MSESSPAVSVIVPAYRTEDTIAETLGSIFSQTFTDFEVIVVSNAGYSAEEELTRILAPWASRIVRVWQQVPGLANGRNAALEACRAPLVALLDSDDIWEADYLAVQVGILRADPTIDVVYPNAIFFGDPASDGQAFMDWFPSKGRVTVTSLLTKQTCVFISVTARLEAVRKAGLFDGSLKGAEDLDLWLRIAKSGGNIAYHPKPLVRYRARPNSLSMDPVVMCEVLLVVLHKTAANMDLTQQERACLTDVIAQQNAQLSFWRGKRALYQSDFGHARRFISESNRYFKRPKIYLISLLLNIAPAPLLAWVRHKYPDEHAFMHS